MSDKTQKEMVDEFITDKQEFDEQQTIDFAKAILDCEIQKKEIADTIKDIKAEAKVVGVQVQQVLKSVKDIKAYYKMSDVDRQDNEDMKDILNQDADIRFKIETLMLE
jgi:uncharacterized protein (UPF0335 family)